MELARRLGTRRSSDTSRSVLTGEILGPEYKAWQDAYLGKSFLDADAYVAILTRRDDPLKRVYVTALAGSFKATSIDIPLRDDTPRELLLSAPAEDNQEALLAFLNRTTAGVGSGEITHWFHRTFGVKHLQPFGPVFVGSHGGTGAFGYKHFATIDSRFPQVEEREDPIKTVIDFTQVVHGAIRHLRITPLPVGQYLSDLQSALKPLPRIRG